MTTLIILALIGACAYAVYHFRKNLEAKAAAEEAALKRSWGLASAPPVPSVNVPPTVPTPSVPKV